MKYNFSRREFLRRSTLTAASGIVAAPFVSRKLFGSTPSNTVLHASIGTANQARADLERLTDSSSVKLVAVADVDSTKSAALKEKYPDVRIYQDWRQLLDKERHLDSLNVSTPDHMHAPIAMSAMQLGKHVYVEKPLTHDLYETRMLTEYARKKKLVTQMGIQIHSASGYRQAVKTIRDGVIGKVREVHAWCGKDKGWGDSSPRPDKSDPVPSGFNWNLWLGTAETRPFIGNGYYHPVNWRKRLDFGTGTFGDMGCHIFDPIFGALELTAPLTIWSGGTAPNQWNWAIDAKVQLIFPGTAYTASNKVSLTWYNGEQEPPRDVLALVAGEQPGCGSIFIGTKGVMLLPHPFRPKLFPEKDFADFNLPKVEDGNHYHTFIEAVRGNAKTTANFDYSGPLTEAVLLGTVATRFPKTTLEWDAKKLKFTNLADANLFLRRRYRKGWEVKGLS
jgi:predicted dehydrogenase